MRAQSAAFGIAAAAALSSTVSALPCGTTAPGQTTISEFTCILTDEISSRQARDQHGDRETGAPESRAQPPVDQSALYVEATEPDGLADAEIFAARGIKITNLQATMTSNNYVAGRLPIAASRPIEDLIMISPDYLSVKTLPHIPKRRPVGVGLVTLPKPTVKDADKSPDGQGLQQNRR